MYLLIQSRIFKSLYSIHVNNIPVIIISDEQHEFENEFDIICGVNARTAFETYVRTHLISYPEKHIFFTNYNIRRMLNYIIGCIIILIATIAALIGQSIGTISGGLDEFQTDALKQYPELKIKKPLPTFEEFCYPKNYAVQKQQKFAAKYMKKSKSRELLVFHKIGAGKTCLAIQIGERFKSKGRILVIMPASLIPGFRNELRSDCAGYITNKDRDKLKKFQPGSIEYKKIIAKSDEHIDEIWQIYSYTTSRPLLLPRRYAPLQSPGLRPTRVFCFFFSTRSKKSK